MAPIPVTFTEDTGWFRTDDGHLVFKEMGRIVIDLGTTGVAPTPGDILVGDGLYFRRVHIGGDAAGAVAGEHLNLTLKSAGKLCLRIPVAAGVDTDANGTGLAGCGAVLDITKTEAAAGLCKVYDDSLAASKFRNIEAASVGDFVQWQLLPNNTQDNDAVYLGAAVPFCALAIDMNVAQTYNADALVWEYWKGDAWAALTLARDNTGAAVKTGRRAFGQDGGITFAPPSNWASSTVDGQAAFWIRARAGTAANITAKGTLNAHRHYLLVPADGFTVPHDCTITAVAICDEAAVIHTTTDIKLVVVNFTKGTTSGELTFAQDKRRDSWGPLTMGCTAGDVLGVLITQEDTAAEAGPFTLELDVTLV